VVEGKMMKPLAKYVIMCGIKLYLVSESQRENRSPVLGLSLGLESRIMRLRIFCVFGEYSRNPVRKTHNIADFI
jgi:hypothetical protein